MNRICGKFGDRSAAFRRGTPVCGRRRYRPGNCVRIVVAFPDEPFGSTGVSFSDTTIALCHPRCRHVGPVEDRGRRSRGTGDGPRITPRCRRFGNAKFLGARSRGSGRRAATVGGASRVHRAPTFSGDRPSLGRRAGKPSSL